MFIFSATSRPEKIEVSNKCCLSKRKKIFFPTAVGYKRSAKVAIRIPLHLGTTRLWTDIQGAKRRAYSHLSAAKNACIAPGCNFRIAPSGTTELGRPQPRRDHEKSVTRRVWI